MGNRYHPHLHVSGPASRFDQESEKRQNNDSVDVHQLSIRDTSPLSHRSRLRSNNEMYCKSEELKLRMVNYLPLNTLTNVLDQ